MADRKQFRPTRRPMAASDDEEEAPPTRRTGAAASGGRAVAGVDRLMSDCESSVPPLAIGISRAPLVSAPVVVACTLGATGANYSAEALSSLRSQQRYTAQAVVSGVSRTNFSDNDDGAEEADDGAIARKAATARSHREQLRKGNAFGTVANVRRSAGRNLTDDADDGYISHAGKAALAASVQSLRAGLASGAAVPRAVSTAVSEGWEVEQLKRAISGNRTENMAVLPVGPVGDAKQQQGEHFAIAASARLPSLGDAAADIQEVMSSIDASILNMNRAAVTGASNAAGSLRGAEDAASALTAMASKRDIASGVFDSFTRLRAQLASTCACLRARGPLVLDLVDATAGVADRCASLRQRRRKADADDEMSASTQGLGAWGILRIASEPPASALPLLSRLSGLTASPADLARALESASRGERKQARLARLHQVGPLLLQRFVWLVSTGRISSLLSDGDRSVLAVETGSDACMDLDSAAAAPTAALSRSWVELFEAADSADAAERLHLKSSLQPLVAAHRLLFADVKPQFCSLGPLLQSLTQWKAGTVTPLSVDAATPTTALPASAVRSSVSQAYVRTYAYLSAQALCEPLVLHGSWAWLTAALLDVPLASASSAAAEALPSGEGALALAGSSSAAAAFVPLDALPWFAPLWAFGESRVYSPESAGISASAGGTVASSSSAAGAAMQVDGGDAALPVEVVAAAALSDEHLLPRVVAAALLPAALRLLPAAYEPLWPSSTRAVRALVDELLAYDLPPEAVAQLLAAVDTALSASVHRFSVPLLLAEGIDGGRSVAAATSPANDDGSGWCDVAASAAPAATPLHLSEATALHMLGAASLLHSVVSWRDVLPAQVLQRIAVCGLMHGCLGPLLRECLLPTPPASSPTQLTTELLHVAGTALSACLGMLPDAWLVPVGHAHSHAHAASASWADVPAALSDLRQWTAAAGRAAGALPAAPAWLPAVARARDAFRL